MSKLKEVFFFTKSYPHQWTSGPQEITLDIDNDYVPIKSIERAKELAEKYATHGDYSESRCVTTYGVKLEYRVADKKDEAKEIAKNG